MSVNACCNSMKDTVIEAVTATLRLLRNPVGEYRTLPCSGGVTEPLLFMARMGFIAGLVKLLINFYHMACGVEMGLFTALSAVVVIPLVAVAVGYLLAFLLFVLMKYLGCGAELETAVRSVSKASVILPLAVVVLLVPYLGNALLVATIAYILRAVATEVYELQSNLATLIFAGGGVVCVVLALVSESFARFAA